LKLLKVGTFPVPARLCEELLESVDEVLAVEELDSVIERQLTYLCGLRGLRARVRGKLTGDMPLAGENTADAVREAVRRFVGGAPAPGAGGAAQAGQASQAAQAGQASQAGQPALAPPPLPARPPVLCAGCPHRGSFLAVKEAARGQKAVFCGDIGCYTLGNAQPLDMVDTCLCMGAGVAQAQGMHRVEPDALNFAFIGDSTFFHSGMPGLVNAVFNRADVIVCVLDNATTAMTGGQANPGMGRTLMGEATPRIDVAALCEAAGADDVQRASAFDLEAAKAAVRHAMDARGVRVIVFEGPCINLPGGKGQALAIIEKECTGCGSCARKLGCPALSMAGAGKAAIDPLLCTGCGLCQAVCKFGAIGCAAEAALGPGAQAQDGGKGARA